MARASSVRGTGSPPHMRGKARAGAGPDGQRGITPAHAGKSAGLAKDQNRVWDHPRTCGEKAFTSSLFQVFSGSPPHMRGKERHGYSHHPRMGITPAHAGKSLIYAIWVCSTWDHPRTCGEKIKYRQKPIQEKGSPPHMRGKVENSARQVSMIGITPAHAGKRLLLQKPQADHWDHPRTCGEKYDHVDVFKLTEGSPPHMRGKGINHFFCGAVLGITPAHAGKSILS